MIAAVKRVVISVSLAFGMMAGAAHGNEDTERVCPRPAIDQCPSLYRKDCRSFSFRNASDDNRTYCGLLDDGLALDRRSCRTFDPKGCIGDTGSKDTGSPADSATVGRATDPLATTLGPNHPDNPKVVLGTMECDAFLDLFDTVGTEPSGEPGSRSAIARNVFAVVKSRCEAPDTNIFDNSVRINDQGRLSLPVMTEEAAIRNDLPVDNNFLKGLNRNQLCEFSVVNLETPEQVQRLSDRIAALETRSQLLSSCNSYFEKVARCIFNVSFDQSEDGSDSNGGVADEFGELYRAYSDWQSSFEGHLTALKSRFRTVHRELRKLKFMKDRARCKTG